MMEASGIGTRQLIPIPSLSSPLRLPPLFPSTSSSSSSRRRFLCAIHYRLPLFSRYPSPSPLPPPPFKSSPFSQSRFAATSLPPSDSNQSVSDTPAAYHANVFQLIQAHQEKAARLPPVEEIKTLLYYNLRGVLATFSLKFEGYPSGSVVDFACDAHGSPILAVSKLAVHTKDLSANSKCSLLVARDPEDRTDLVVTVHGDAVPVEETERQAIRSTYLARHPDAFWVDFGDFQFLRIEPVVVRYVSGVATALLGSGEFSKDEFRAAKVDPIYRFSKPITSHMNKDHAEDTKLIVRHSTSVPVEYAYMVDIDSLGFNVKAGYEGNSVKIRIPFARRAEDRKDVKTLIVEMLEEAAGAAKS